MTINYYSENESELAYKSDAAAGFDISADLSGQIQCYTSLNRPSEVKAINDTLVLQPQCRYKIPTGIYTDPQTEDAIWFALCLRSSIGWGLGLQIPNSIGVIDKDYRGQWHIILYNPLPTAVMIKHGERIAQAILLPFIKASFNLVPKDHLTATSRGEGGFGSTNK